ncbi:MAG: hypothetical protein RL497_852 [Pseudomonadota bacterium]
MHYHDYHLSKYEVSDRGETIILHLLYEYAGEETDESHIKFSNVALYNFVHTSGTIITDIEEIPVADFIQKISKDVIEWNRMYSVNFWKDSLENYIHTLQTEGYKAWSIESAIGFYGFIIAKSVSDI